MKLLLVLAIVVLAVYSTEACRSHSDCDSFGANCASGHYACVFHQCHCTTGNTGDKCTDSSNCPDCHETYLGKHCVDGNCRCTFELGNLGGILGGLGK